jgi:hypothetical protein
MLRYLNTFARNIWLLIIPVLLIPLVVNVMGKSVYTAKANLWVEQPLYVDQQRRADGSSSDSPSKQLVSLFNELMSTNTFLNNILENTTMLKASVENEADRIATLDSISKSVKIEAGSWRLITLTVTGEQSKQTLELLQAVVNRLTVYYDDRVTSQNKSAVAYYQSQLDKANAALKDATDKMDQFLAAHPNANGADSAAKATSAEQIEYVNLSQNRDAARRDYDDARTNLQRLDASYNAYKQGQDTNLRVQDKPYVEAAPGDGRFRSLLMGVGISLAVGGILVTLIVIVMTWLDRSVRQPYHAQQLLGVRTLSLPDINPPHGWRASSGQDKFRLRSSLGEQFGAYSDNQLPGARR